MTVISIVQEVRFLAAGVVLLAAAGLLLARRREKNLQLRQPTLPLTCEETVA
jgi:hypothetical protein